MEKTFTLEVLKKYFDKQLNGYRLVGDKITIDEERARVLLPTGWFKILSIKRIRQKGGQKPPSAIT